MMRSPVWRIGGKGNHLKRLLSKIPTHKIYCEVFGGSAALLLNKPPSPIEILNDLDEGLVHFFRVLRDPDKFALLQQKLELTPCSRSEYHHSLKTWNDEPDSVDRALKWFVVNRQSFSGRFGSGWGFSVNKSRRNRAGAVSEWQTAISDMKQFNERLLRVQIECHDWEKILATYDSEDTFFFLDPPYVHSTRTMDIYTHEMTDQDHERLCHAILSLKGKWLLCGYDNPIYRILESNPNVHREQFQTSCYAAGRTRTSKLQGANSAKMLQPRTEVLWWNEDPLQANS